MSGRAGLVVLAAGGTGGHMFPAEALAAELFARGHRVALVTDRRGAAFRVGGGTVETHRVPVRRLSGGFLGRAAALAELARGTVAAARLLRRLAPAAVVGFGGYASFPAVLAATRAGRPTLIHEQNAVLGRANRWLAGRVSAIATSFHEVAGLEPAGRAKATLTGNPVRAAVAALAREPYPLPAPGTPLRLLVTGGSQGARVFSDVVPAAVAALPEALRRRLAVAQQARAEDVGRARAAYVRAGVAAEVAPFFADLPRLLARAHLVICRSGASSVAEITAAGRPAVLVPYPHAADDHQSANARAVARLGAAWVMPQPEFTAPALAERLGRILETPQELAAAAERARAAGHPDAAQQLAALVAALMPNGGGAEAPEAARRREKAA